MSQITKATVLATGFSMFSMFFGAGNVVFPLVLGKTSGQYVDFAALGLTLTGIILPFLGLFAMTLFKGDYKRFFMRLGKIPAFFMIFLLMALLGPFAGMPRTITLSQTTLAFSGAEIPAWFFNGIFCLLFLGLAYQRNKIVDVLGYVLTPVLLILLAVLIIAGLMQPALSEPQLIEATAMGMFWNGAMEGYNTMDLMAALFFSTVIIAALQSRFNHDNSAERQKNILRHTAYASILGGILLGLVYVGFCFLASKYSINLQDLNADELIAHISYQVLGNKAGWIVNGVVILACLTTAIALASVFAEVVCELFTNDSRYYHAFLIGTTLTAYAMSFVGFTGIVALIYPLLVICYPAIIVLTICNLGHKLWGWTLVKTPVFITAGLSLAAYLVL